MFSIVDDEFRDWILAQDKSKETIRKIVIHTKKIQSHANTDDNSQQLDSIYRLEANINVLHTLAYSSKFQGHYDSFTGLKRYFNLEWIS